MKPGWREYHDSIRERQFSVTDLVRSPRNLALFGSVCDSQPLHENTSIAH